MVLRVKVFVVTYKNEEILLTRALPSLLRENYGSDLVTFTVLNNYGKLTLPEDIREYVEVIDNAARPNWSTGHLARSWNQCLMHGFRDLGNPEADLVICMQNDTQLVPGWYKRLREVHSEVDFLSLGRGDEFHSYTVDAVKKVGIWDERFCGIGYQEADYFLRAFFHLGPLASINDPDHFRVWNPIENADQICDIDVLTGNYRGDPIHEDSVRTGHVWSEKFYAAKWGTSPGPWHLEVRSLTLWSRNVY